MEQYHRLRSLWRIEQCFRIMKTFLEARPIYVRTEEHIRGHFVLCYIALVIERLCLRKLKEGYDLIQGSRFVKGGIAENTPLSRWLAVRFIHAPLISLGARHWFTDTTNAYRAYSRAYLTHPAVQPFRDVFAGYELLAYLSIRATRLGLKACEVPVTRAYPASGATPTKIKGFKGNSDLLKVLLAAARGKYNPQ